MKITGCQLRQIIKEAMPRGGVPDVVGAVTGVPQGNIQNLVDEYKEWAVDYMGTPSGASSASVLATFIVDKGLDQGVSGESIVRDMARAMRFDSVDVRKEVKRQRAEYDAGGTLSDQETYDRGFKEGVIKLTRNKLRRIIKEELKTMSVDKRDQLMDALEDKYGLNVRTTEEFGSGPGGVWLSGESDIPKTSDGLPLFDYYMDVDPYEFGVHPEFSKFIEPYGFFAEWNDPGTLMLWRN